MASILSTRIDQMLAITLPSDTHRTELLKAMREIPSLQRKLSSFLDYMIDYTATLNHELFATKDQVSRTPCSASSPVSDSVARRVGNEDYERCIELLGAGAGALLQQVKKLKDENAQLRLEVRRLTENQRGEEHDVGDRVMEYSSLDELKHQFSEVEQELRGLQKDVRSQFDGLRRRPL